LNKIKNIDKIKNKVKGIIMTGSSLKLTKNISFDNYSFNFYYISKFDVPVYGLCFGCQLLNLMYGGTLKDNKKYICRDVTFHKYDSTHILLKNITTDDYWYCFSDIVIPNKKIPVTVFATISVNNKILGCGFEFEKNKVFGSLFHPEYYSNTPIIISNFYDLCKKYKGGYIG
jgi:anthranilate/para-aminobenzoate synthase component II